MLAAAPIISLASESSHPDSTSVGLVFLWIAIILLIAKASSFIERFGQPPVLGEILIGVLLGNLSLLGFHWFEPLRGNEIILFLSEFGVVILLFQIGLESNLAQMKKVGLRALLVAIVGVIVPFVLGTFVIGPWLIPGLVFNAYLFLGATLTATSVGITARVFKDLGKLKTNEAQIVLGAAVIDDVLGLIILAVVTAIVTQGSVSPTGISLITLKAFAFLAGAIYIGTKIAPWLGKMFSKIHTGTGMKFTLALSFGLIVAYLAEKIGLAPIVGAFAAGLILDSVHFKYFKQSPLVENLQIVADRAEGTIKQEMTDLAKKHSEKHIEELIEPLGFLVVPIFFVMTGFSVRLEVLFDLPVLMIALAVSVAAFIGKIVAGSVAGKVNKWIVGVGMIPRGEVGLIFAMIGKNLGVVDDRLFSIIVIMVILSTLLTPPILTLLIKKQDSK
ncbi:cation:proton antiporter [Candidatus Falkowbacteria bacterium]|uniref:Cation:proton antiporter n=1 Tax=Candidatus Falkowbacteria bacterium CG10_big_fil_rev_8_21_14_0_10_37_18 TaxID=1974562 RepID=A0A2H0V9I8_9BACT|nr:cation:proton antiporter [Candidatus Falkowbacteria bacterium]NCQ13040.1 cation:proton antiporter [Candidatus Falkowbacteria bacterium]PIR95731.1 MAG: cation:proton antiporter [Candidatus Falkowbacteria bacterium CG10_big_fil_rev_8_21_14_0_10_37_18]